MATQQLKRKLLLLLWCLLKKFINLGGSSGIGHAIATRFINEGGKVTIADVNEDAGKKVAEGLNANKSETVAIFHKTDVSKWNELKGLFNKTKETFGRIDVVVNNAGITGVTNAMLDDSFDEPTHFNKIVDVDLMGVVYGTKLALQYLKQNNPPGGMILNTASISAVYPMFPYAVYAATKAGVINLTRTMAQVSHLNNITVNAVCPSATRTGMAVGPAADAVPKHWWSPVDNVVEAYFKCIYNPKINGSIFSVWSKEIKEEKFEESPPVVNEMNQGSFEQYLSSVKKE